MNAPVERSKDAFWPSHAQFVMFDVHAPFDKDEPPLWSLESEADQPLSVRRTDLAVALLIDAPVDVELLVDAQQRSMPAGHWDVAREAEMVVASGELGVRGVLENEPRVTLVVPAGNLELRVLGRLVEDRQVFHIQVWPAPSRGV